MTAKRKRSSAEFKAKVALEALRGELTTKHGLGQNGSEGGRPGRSGGEAARQDRAARVVEAIFKWHPSARLR